MRFVQRKIVVLGLVFAVAPLSAQSVASATETQSRTSTIVASFSKFKNVSKTRRGITKAKYLKVESEAAVKANPADYSGVYEVPGIAFGLNLTVAPNGVVTGTGNEALTESVRRTFVIRDGRVQGALLTATKVYADGRTERLEGAFMNRAVFESPNDPGVTIFGFGTLGPEIRVSGVTVNRFFYERAR
jgi:hypothetical protein